MQNLIKPSSNEEAIQTIEVLRIKESLSIRVKQALHRRLNYIAQNFKEYDPKEANMLIKHAAEKQSQYAQKIKWINEQIEEIKNKISAYEGLKIHDIVKPTEATIAEKPIWNPETRKSVNLINTVWIIKRIDPERLDAYECLCSTAGIEYESRRFEKNELKVLGRCSHY